MTTAKTMTSATGRVHDNSRGFSLIEVLVAIVVLSTGIVAVLYSFDTAVSALAASRDVMRSNLLLQQKLDEISWRGLPHADVGEFSGTDSEFYWKITAAPSHASLRPGLNDITVSVSRGEDGPRQVLVTRIRLDRRNRR